MLWTWHLQLSAWSPDGIGHPNSVPTLNPLAWLKIALAALLPASVGVKAYLWLSIAVAAAGIYRLARVIGLAEVFASVAAVLFTASPYVFAKIASGQSSEWSAAAAFIWGLSASILAFRNASIRHAAIAAACYALATNQLQFLAFAQLAALLAWCIYRGRSGWKIWATISAGSTVFALPALWFLATRGPTAGAGVSPPYASWEFAQSSSLGDTFALLGYAARYPETFLSSIDPRWVAVVRWSLWGTGATALAGCILARSRAALLLGVMGAVGVLWVAGTRGPAADVWQWLFAGVPLSAFLRELYHGAILLAVPYAVLPAIALERLSRRRPWSAATAATVLGCFSGLATWLGGLGPTLTHVTPPAYADAVRAALPVRDARVLFVPPERPLFVSGDRVGGVDAFDWAGSDQLSLFEYYPPAPVAFSAAALDALDLDGMRRVLPRLGCDAIVWRPDVTSPLWTSSLASFAHAWPGAVRRLGDASYFPLDAPAMVSGARASAALPPALDRMSADTSIVYLDVPGIDASTLLPAWLAAPQPSNGWVGYRDLYASFVEGLATPTLGVVTTRIGATIDVPARHTALLLWAPDGAVVGEKTIRSKSYVRVPIDGMTSIRALGPSAIGELDEAPRTMAVQPSYVTAQRILPWSYRGTVTLHGHGLVVLRQRFDDGWTLHADGAQVIEHDRADGFGNAWVLTGDGSVPFTITYAPQNTTFALLAFSGIAAIALALAIVRRDAVQRAHGE